MAAHHSLCWLAVLRATTQRDPNLIDEICVREWPLAPSSAHDANRRNKDAPCCVRSHPLCQLVKVIAPAIVTHRTVAGRTCAPLPHPFSAARSPRGSLRFRSPQRLPHRQNPVKDFCRRVFHPVSRGGIRHASSGHSSYHETNNSSSPAGHPTTSAAPLAQRGGHSTSIIRQIENVPYR
jgi:hypothetical protein